MRWRRAVGTALGTLLRPAPALLLSAPALLLSAAALLLPVPALALDLTGSMRTSAEWDSNVARRDGPGRTDDFIFRFFPQVELREDDGKFQWLVNYRFPYDIAVETSRLDGFRHFLNGSGDYYISERTSLFVTNQFSKSDAVGNVRADAVDAPTVSSFNQTVYRNRVTGGVRHSLTPRVGSTLSFSHRYFDSNLANRATVNSFIGSGSISYALDPRHRVGGGTRATYQDFSESNNGNRSPRQSLFLNLFASWSWVVDELTALSVQAGPTFVQTYQDAPSTPGARSSSDSNWDVFAQASISRRWRPDHVSSVSYTRSESATSGLGSSVLDAVNLIHNWQISELWSASLRGAFTRRESVTSITETDGLTTRRVDQDANIVRWTVRANIDRRLTRHLRAGVRYSYNNQDSSETASVRFSNFDNHIGTIGIQYDFDRYSLDRYLPW